MRHKDFIGEFNGAFEPEYCTEVINATDKLLAAGWGVQRPEPQTMKADTSLHANEWVTHPPELNQGAFTGLVSDGFNDRFYQYFNDYKTDYAILHEADPVGLNVNKVQKSEIGQGYHVWHYEGARKRTSHLQFAYILYLNDVTEGGETEFLYYPRRIKPEKGKLLIFPAGFTHTHRGNAPLSNSKYILTGWLEY